MAGFATLRDALVGREVPCRMRGCTRTWLWRKEDQFKAGSGGKPSLEPPKRMCDPCAERAAAAADRDVACSKPGCEGSWRWSKFAQVEAWLRAGEKEPPEPRGLCDGCRSQLEAQEDRAVPCRVRGCTNTWLWPARQQLLAGPDAPPPERMCERCEGVFRGLRNRDVPCKIRGCKRAWIYSKWSQLEAIAAGRKDDPARMCDPCAARYAEIADREVPCRIKGCAHTWTWSRGSQLEVELAQPPVADGETPPALEPPQRMCADCYKRWSGLADQQVPCKRRGCAGTWTWKRGEQLTAKDPSPPHRFCEECLGAMGKLHDVEVPCEHQVDGCKGTWTWTRLAQLSAEKHHRKDPPKHACPSCAEFLRAAKTIEIPCTRCQHVITWPPHSQLMTRLGKWVQPSLCGTCKRDETAHPHHPAPPESTPH